MERVVNRSSVSRSIAKSLGASNDLEALASGVRPVGSYMPTSEGEYWQYRRFLHDVFCHSLIDNGTYTDSEFRLHKLGLTTENTKLNMQKPDLYKMQGETLLLGELTATYNVEKSLLDKQEKYHDLVEFLENNQVKTQLDIFAVDLTDPEWSDNFPEISGLHMSMINDLLDNLRLVHTQPRFSNLRSGAEGYSLNRFQFKLEDECLVKHVEDATGIIAEPDYIKKCIERPGTFDMSDETYIDGIASAILGNQGKERPFPEPRPKDPQELTQEFETLFNSPPTTTKIPRILQLGCPRSPQESLLGFRESVEYLKKSSNTGGYLTYILDFLTKNQLEETRILTLSLPPDVKRQEFEDGPGRKAYLRRNGMTIKREEPRHIGVKDSHEARLEGFIDELSNLRNCSIMEFPEPSTSHTGLTMGIEINYIMDKINSHPFSSVLMFYQKISTEIVLNSMRRRKGNEYCIGFSGFTGVYFIVAPGPQLRTENNVEFIKIISLVPPVSSGLSAPWSSIGDHWESEWLSVDVDRLKHWQRCYDRVTVAMLSNSERLVRPGLTFRSAVKEELACGNYTFLGLTYLENKQLTSVTNQTIRYLWMKALGDKNFKGLAAKFPPRVNSVIQSTMILRSVRTCAAIVKMSLEDLIKVKRLSRDDQTGFYDEATTGVTNLLPRLFTSGPLVPISYNLNEIYWCMAYNKDRQNAGQDALRILEKIVQEEDKYDKEISTREGLKKVDYFLGNTTLREDISHVLSDKPESHFYSARAVSIGMKEQFTHPDNMGDNNSWNTNEKIERVLSKPLSEYATFKASVNSIQRHINPFDLSEIKKLGVRTKAIELVANLIEDEKLLSASELAMTFSGNQNFTFEIFIQIFKKGQIGGVREIIILWIKARVMMNIVEEIARLICKSDRREILTKGRDKRLMMRGDFEEVTTSFPKGTPLKVIKESFDMTVWCQKFIPAIFMQIHEISMKQRPGIRDLSRLIFLAHSNKTIEIPRKLAEMWTKHPEEYHKKDYMQKVKELYLNKGKTHFVNHSNMCQGIPHYHSSVLGLSCISLRDKLFSKCIKKLGIEKAIKWKTRLGSDDKGTIIAADLSKPTSILQARLLGQCERASERLHSMELSIKSASGHVMYELNSAYMANLETLSPTIKFALAATDVIETTSCTTFVNESFSRIRQLRENGCSSLICAISHYLNKRHFDMIFDTGLGGLNNVQQIFMQPPSTIPYDFGVYPIFDCDLHEVLGPEYYNFKIHNKQLEKNSKRNIALELLYTPLSRRETDEMFNKEDDPVLKKDHFGIHQGLVRQLANMRARVKANAEEVESYFENNPYLIVRGPENWEEALMLVKSKLFTKGAAQSLRRTSPAIYIGRLSAFRSASAWTITERVKVGNDIETGDDLFVTQRTRSTYKEFLVNGINKIRETATSVDFSALLETLFPQRASFNIAMQMEGKFGYVESSDKKYSQAVRTWTVNNFNYEFTANLRSILLTSFGQTTDSSKEDVEEFKKLVGLNLTSLEGLKEECKERGIRPLDMFFYMSRIHKLSKSSKIQAFSHGPSTNSLHLTLSTIKRFCHFPGSVSTMPGTFTHDLNSDANTISTKLDLLKIFHNFVLIEETNKLSKSGGRLLDIRFDDHSLVEVCTTIVRSIKSISGFDFTSQKSLRLAACKLLQGPELRDKLVQWKDTNFSYIKRQKRHLTKSGKIQWSGNLEVLVSSGNECYTINERFGDRYLVTKSVLEPDVFFRSLVQMCKILSMDIGTFFEQSSMEQGDYFLSDNTKTMHRSEVSKSSATKLKLTVTKQFKYKHLTDLSEFKIVKSKIGKDLSFSYHLEDKDGRTATVFHSSGNYYPVEMPTQFSTGDGEFYEGVRLNKLLENRQWFINGKLPPMSEDEVYRFLIEDVDYSVITGLEQSDVARINNYIEVRSEVNEESFSILRTIQTDNKIVAQDVTYTSEELSKLFRREMEREMEAGFGQQLQEEVHGETQWADYDEFGLDDLLDQDKEEMITVVKSLGYKPPPKRAQVHTISTLQQGSFLLRSVLNCFFLSQDIKNERSSNLPRYIKWLDYEGLNSDIHLCLRKHILRTCSELFNVLPSKVEEAIITAPSTSRMDIQMLTNIINKTPPRLTNFDEILSQLREDYQPDVSDDDDN